MKEAARGEGSPVVSLRRVPGTPHDGDGDEGDAVGSGEVDHSAVGRPPRRKGRLGAHDVGNVKTDR